MKYTVAMVVTPLMVVMVTTLFLGKQVMTQLLAVTGLMLFMAAMEMTTYRIVVIQLFTGIVEMTILVALIQVD